MTEHEKNLAQEKKIANKLFLDDPIGMDFCPI